jgi:hypothetical protein
MKLAIAISAGMLLLALMLGLSLTNNLDSPADLRLMLWSM